MKKKKVKTPLKGKPWLTPKGTKPVPLKKTTFVRNLSLEEWKATHPNAK